MRNLTATLFGITLGLNIATAYGSNVVSASQSAIARVDVYTEWGNGDIIFTLANNSLQASCPYGFWIRATDSGAQSTLAHVEAAYHTGSPVIVWADTTTIWNGSSSSACLVWMVSSY